MQIPVRHYHHLAHKAGAGFAQGSCSNPVEGDQAVHALCLPGHEGNNDHGDLNHEFQELVDY